MFVFIINPSAGKGKATNYWRKMEEKLQAKNVSYRELMSSSEEETRKFIHSLQAHHLKAVCIIGGDGTISSVIQELANTPIPLAIFPAGSGNDTVRTFKLTNHPQQFITSLLAGKTTQIDLLSVNHRFGMTVAGVGIDTVIGDKVNRSVLKPLLNKFGIGSLSYLISAISTAFTFQPFDAKVTIDNSEFTVQRAWLIACGNTSSYGGGLTICPQAVPTDGQLNVTMFHSLERFKAMIRIFPTLLRGKPINKPGITYMTGTILQITTDRPIPAILDGELINANSLRIKLHPKALHLLLTR